RASGRGGGPARRRRTARTGNREARPGAGVPGTDRRQGGDPMTAVTTTPEPQTASAPGPAEASGGRAVHLVRSELLKIRTTNTWWIFLIGVFVATALAATVWIAVGNSQINTAAAGGEEFVPPENASEAELEITRQQSELSQDLTRTLHDASA